MVILVRAPERTAPPIPLEQPLPLSITDTQSTAQNYMDCTESNGEEEEEEGEEDPSEEEMKKEIKKEGEEDRKVTDEEASERKDTEGERKESDPPRWADFFTTETLTDSQNSQSHSCCSHPSTSPSRMTGSQTPDLFSESNGNEEEEIFALTLSASTSNHSSPNQDSNLPDTIILQSEQERQVDTRTDVIAERKESDSQTLQSEPRELSESQVSSDFDVPCTPESKIPGPDELSQLYRKLASGEEVIIRIGSQGST